MPSRVELRVTAEHVLRGAVIAALVLMLWQSLNAGQPTANANVVSRTLADRLPRWSRLPVAPGGIHLRLDSVPTPLERDWLRALSAAGAPVTWSGDLLAVLVSAEPVASPGGGVRVRVAAATGEMIELRDDVGLLDTVRASDGGASLVTGAAAGELVARVSHSAATAMAPDSVVLRKLLVIGRAGWESKFVIAALEEDGWSVDAFIPVAPGADVTQGQVAPIDTSRYSAVVILDDAGAPYADRIVAFVRSGGGVVLGSRAAALDALGLLRVGTVGSLTVMAPGVSGSGSISLASLAVSPMIELKSDAVPLGRRGGAVAVAARRIGAGRAIQSGYEDTWRWRMGGGDNSVTDHRAWWTGLVSNVAYAPRIPLGRHASAAEDAPVARLVAAIGPGKVNAGVAKEAVTPTHWMPWLFIFLAFALTTEVASRRLRGSR